MSKPQMVLVHKKGREERHSSRRRGFIVVECAVSVLGMARETLPGAEAAIIATCVFWPAYFF
jgi:hypothetical protein